MNTICINKLLQFFESVMDEEKDGWKMIIRDNPESVLLLDDTVSQEITEELQLYAIHLKGSVLSQVPDQTGDLCRKAVMMDPLNIRYVRSNNKTQKLCDSAMTADINVFQYVDEEYQMMNMCRLVISIDPTMINYIKSEKTVLSFINENSELFVSNQR